ncbi:MAG TPA: penicillin acylase family protein [Candidatus Polarisedimenticolaceae bacterium]|nr:penicillin acylase family protein [Candidatus Polarisedimenticolaceae bacterium]
MIARIAALAAIALVLAGLAGLAVLLWPLPTRRGTATIGGLATPVEATYDRQGIPHVRSVLEIDAWRTLGWVHAADRLFQMELRRRAAAGRLSEVFGTAALEMDKRARTLGFASMAEHDWDVAPDDDRAILQAYADGVNAYLADHPLPLELEVLHLHPEPWTPLDSLSFQRLMFDDLSIAASREQELFDDARARGLAAVKQYDASEGGTTEVAPEIAELLRGDSFRNSEVRVSEAVPSSSPAGSNAWALSGERTASKKPLLAGDPHLDAERPGVWYAAHLTSADGLDVAGLTLAGAPAILIGHTARVAWSITMNQADDGDLFLEKLDGAAALTRKETIHVKGSGDVVLEVARTANGPIVERLDGGYGLARRFAPDGETNGIRAFLDAARAKTGTALLGAFSRYGGPALNVCWADTEGHVGVHVAGAVPARIAGSGRFPVPAWTGAYGWEGRIPFDRLPAVADPKEGFVVTANDDWSVAGRPLPYPGLYATSDRAGRARQLAQALTRAKVADMRAMQADVYSPYAARIVAALARDTFADPGARRAVTILQHWDRHADTTGPSHLFYAFLGELRREIAKAAPAASWSLLDRLVTGEAPDTYWDGEKRDARLSKALASALASIEKSEGSSPDRWSFGAAHRLSYPHLFAGELPGAVARRLAFGPVALPGEWNTLDVAGFSLRSDRFDVRHIPSARLIVDLGDLDQSRLVLPLGQSGQLFDRHAHDQLDAWSTNEDFPLPFTRAAVDAAAVSTMRFVPAD